MSLSVIIGAATLALSLPLLWWSVAARAPGSAELVSRNLQRGRAGVVDLRELLLARSARERAVGPAVRALAARMRRLTPAGWLAALERKVVHAGLSSSWPVDRVLATKLLLTVTVVGLAAMDLSRNPGAARLIGWLLAATAAQFTPDAALLHAASQRAKEIQRELPDTLDQITISVEAGLGFEAALARTARAGRGPLAQELIRTLQEIQIGVPRSQALRSLMDRSKVVELRHVVLAIMQAESYGLPIAHVLRIQAKELRVKRRQRAEERALKIPVKIVFPLAVCILPSLFIVILGPAGIRIWRFFTASGLP